MEDNIKSLRIWRIKMRFLSLLAATLVLAGCSTITQLGPNTYAIEGGTAVVSSRAKAVCDRQGKKVLVTNYNSANSFIFKCLDEDDPKYRDLKYEERPNTVIEGRR